jgi:uncharacterized protein (TIGR02246 family)
MHRIAKIIKTGMIVSALAITASADESAKTFSTPAGPFDFDTIASVPGSPTVGYLAGTEINGMIEDMIKHWNSKDLEGYLSYYLKSPELIVAVDGVAQIGWKEFAEHYYRGFANRELMGRCTSARVQVRMLGPDTAFVINYWTVSFPQRTVVGMDTNIVQRLNGAWKITIAHSSELEM